jgi:hypothetical protein
MTHHGDILYLAQVEVVSPCGPGASKLCVDVKDFGYGKCSTCAFAGTVAVNCTCAVSLVNLAAVPAGMWHCM